MELNECINYLITATQKKVTQYFAEKISPCDVTPVQYGVLKCLWDNDFQTPTQIANMLSLDGSSITGLLDRMENKGLVKRIPNSNDRRALQVMLTSRGKALEKPLSQLIEEAHNEVLQPLSSTEQDQLIGFLDAILTHLESGSAANNHPQDTKKS